jgi:hypothetical protein
MSATLHFGFEALLDVGGCLVLAALAAFGAYAPVAPGRSDSAFVSGRGLY